MQILSLKAASLVTEQFLWYYGAKVSQIADINVLVTIGSGVLILYNSISAL